MRLSLPRVGIVVAFAAMLSLGCASEQSNRSTSLQSRQPITRGIALPSTEMLDLAAERGADVAFGPEFARNDFRLGAPPVATSVSVWYERDVRDRQLVLSGQSQPEYTQTVRLRERIGP